jgi:hypothetical protein
MAGMDNPVAEVALALLGVIALIAAVLVGHPSIHRHARRR